jgi:hypothetical protein
MLVCVFAWPCKVVLGHAQSNKALIRYYAACEWEQVASAGGRGHLRLGPYLYVVSVRRLSSIDYSTIKLCQTVNQPLFSQGVGSRSDGVCNQTGSGLGTSPAGQTGRDSPLKKQDGRHTEREKQITPSSFHTPLQLTTAVLGAGITDVYCCGQLLCDGPRATVPRQAGPSPGTVRAICTTAGQLHGCSTTSVVRHRTGCQLGFWASGLLGWASRVKAPEDTCTQVPATVTAT